MRKRSGAIIFGIFVIIVIVLYYLVPVAKRFIDANTALVTLLGVLIGIFLWWNSRQSEKKKFETGSYPEFEVKGEYSKDSKDQKT